MHLETYKDEEKDNVCDWKLKDKELSLQYDNNFPDVCSDSNMFLPRPNNESCL